MLLSFGILRVQCVSISLVMISPAEIFSANMYREASEYKASSASYLFKDSVRVWYFHCWIRSNSISGMQVTQIQIETDVKIIFFRLFKMVIPPKAVPPEKGKILF